MVDTLLYNEGSVLECVNLQSEEGVRTDCLAKRERLALTSDNDDNLARVQDGLDTDGECHTRNFIDAPAKEACVRKDGVIGQGLDASTRVQRGAYTTRQLRSKEPVTH